MIDKLTKVNLTMHMSFDKPNKNGFVFTKEAIKDVVCNFPKNIPIIYEDDVVGTTIGEPHIVTWDSENQVCNMTLDGVLFHCNPRIVVNEIKDDVISDFRIVSIGLTK